MANYTFLDTKTDKQFDIDMPISELDDYKARNPHLQQLISRAPALSSGIGSRKPDSGFRDVLKRIKKGSARNNTINTW